MPMLLLDAGFSLVAANPAARTRLGLATDQVPAWLLRHLPQRSGDAPSEVVDLWTRDDRGAPWSVSAVDVSDDPSIDGDWLVTVVCGGPNLMERCVLFAGRFGLTPREGQIVDLLADGLSNRQIAAAVDLAEATIKAHLASVMRKTGSASRTELLTLVHEVHLRGRCAEIPPDAQRTRTGHAWQDADGIVHCTQDPGTRFEVEDVEAFREVIAGFAVDGPVRIYSDATEVRSTSSEARRRSGEPVAGVSALAIRGGSAVSRALVHLWLRVAPPPYPVRMFADREKALAWLRAQPPR